MAQLWPSAASSLRRRRDTFTHAVHVAHTRDTRAHIAHALPRRVCEYASRSQHDSDAVTHDARGAAVVDFALDQRDEFVVVVQRVGVRVLRVADAVASHDGEMAQTSPLVSLHASTVRRRVAGRGVRLGFGFAAAQCLGSTLCLAIAYTHWPTVDVVDLECVDEQTCSCTRSFDLRRVRGAAHDGDECAPCARDVVPVSDTTMLAALSDGSTAWLDTRSAQPCVCTAAHGVGASPPAPLTGAALVRAYSTSGMQLLCGTQRGHVLLWDVRHTRSAVAVHDAGGEVGKLHVTHRAWRHCSGEARFGSPLVWFATFAGSVSALAVGGMEMTPCVALPLASARRNEATVHLPTPPLAVCASHDLLCYGDVDGNQLMLFDLAAVHRNDAGGTRSDRRERHLAVAERDTTLLAREHVTRAALLGCVTCGTAPTQQLSCAAFVEAERSLVVGYASGDVALLRVTGETT